MSNAWRELCAACDASENSETVAIPYTLHGDYVGALVYESNARVLFDRFPALLFEDWPAHNACQLSVCRETINREIRLLRWAGDSDPRGVVSDILELAQIVRDLSEYALLDEFHYSELQLERLGEDWEFLVRNCWEDWWDSLSREQQERASSEAFRVCFDEGMYHEEHRNVYWREADALAELRKAAEHVSNA